MAQAKRRRISACLVVAVALPACTASWIVIFPSIPVEATGTAACVDADTAGAVDAAVAAVAAAAVEMGSTMLFVLHMSKLCLQYFIQKACLQREILIGLWQMHQNSKA